MAHNLAYACKRPISAHAAASVSGPSTAKIVLVVLACAAILVRAVELPANVFSLLRIAVSILAVGFVCFAPYKSLAKRALVVFAIEAICGCTAFMMVDVPFVFDHQAQIGAAAVAVAQRVDRIERDFSGHELTGP